MSDHNIPPSDSQPVPPPPGGPLTPAPGSAAPVVPVGASPSNGIGTAALIMGILQFFCLGTIGSILAVVFGKMGMNKAARGEATNGGVAKAGFWLGIVGLILSVIGIVLTVVLVVFVGKAASDSIDPAVNSQTGLADGNYVMEVNVSLALNDRCSFSGPTVHAEDSAPAGDIRVAGSGSAECGSGDTPDMVAFTVSGGVAQIVAIQ